MAVEAYTEGGLSDKSSYECFHEFQFDVEDKERSGMPQMWEQVKFETFLEKNSCEMQEKLALTSRATQQRISHRFKSLKMNEIG